MREVHVPWRIALMLRAGRIASLVPSMDALIMRTSMMASVPYRVGGPHQLLYQSMPG
jgi:hypothetical protein